MPPEVDGREEGGGRFAADADACEVDGREEDDGIGLSTTPVPPEVDCPVARGVDDPEEVGK